MGSLATGRTPGPSAGPPGDRSPSPRRFDLGGQLAWLPLCAALLAVVAAGLGGKGGLAVIGLGLVVAIGVALLRSSTSAVLLWFAAALFGDAVGGVSTLSPDRLAFLAVLAVWLIEVATGRHQIPRFGATEVFMFSYVAWLVGSAIMPHAYRATTLEGGDQSVITLIQTSAFVPFALFIVARTAMRSRAAVASFLWFLVAIGTYLSLTNCFQFLGPKSLVWPRSILDSKWIGRAAGIFDQPIITGFAISIALAAAVLLASSRDINHRWLAAVAIIPMGPAIYFTHSRSPLLGTALILIGGLLFARSFRTGFAILTAVAALLVVVNWSTFTSSDREKGGVTSQNEVDDRLNGIATSLAAIQEKPIFGHGIGRFAQVNTFEHKQFGLTDWRRGYGIASHETELGIATEVGLVGFGLWVAVLVSLLAKVGRAWRVLPRSGIDGQSFAALFFIIFVAWIANGLTLDIRFFDVANGVVFCWAGIAVGCGERAVEERAASSSGARFPRDRRWGSR